MTRTRELVAGLMFFLIPSLCWADYVCSKKETPMPTAQRELFARAVLAMRAALLPPPEGWTMNQPTVRSPNVALCIDFKNAPLVFSASTSYVARPTAEAQRRYHAAQVAQRKEIEALRKYPVMNAAVDGNDIIYHEYYDIGVAVSTDRGLVVPVLRNAETLGFAQIERQINDYGVRARSGGLALEELQGGTFTITNGGVFGSMLSTPILNAPQSAILGMHKIQDRPMAVGGQVVVRPIMYLAVTYDHRIIDGREAVQFLVSIKDALEDPGRMLIGI